MGEIPEVWGDDFEARYPDKYKDISRFKIMHDWVVSTKQSAATGNLLTEAYTDIDGNTHTYDTAVYRLAKFKTEFEDHFDMHYSLIYYVYTFFALMVDQRAKNMFLTYWGTTGKWQPWFYDNDTCFGINNEGGLVFDYYHEDHDRVGDANVYNGQNSTLWVNFRESFPDKIQETYQDLRSNSVLNYDELVDQFITKGSNKWSESVYNEDGDFKYVSMLRSDNDATNLQQVRGTGEEHFRYYIENRLNYCDSKWYAADYADDYAIVRIYTPVDEDGVPLTDLAIPANANITVTPYSHMYAGVRYKANGTLYQHRTSANEVYTFEAPNEVFNDTETAIYGASQLSSLGDLAPLYCGYIDVSKATKLVELKVGDDTEGYSNTNLEHLAVGTNRLLKKINVCNCPDLTESLGLTGCPNIEEIYATGSGITGVELPDSGYLKIVHLPATISNLTLKNQLYIEDLTLQGYGALKTLWLENCPAIDSLTMVNNAVNLERVRLTNVDWHWDDASVLVALSARNIGGIDENGSNTDHMWVDGKCHIKNLTGAQLNQIRTLYPYLDITYTTLTSQLVYMTDDGLTELHRETITNIGNGTDPVANNTISTPTKESTAQYHFTYSGWSLTSGGDADRNALLNVEGDRYVYAAYTKAIRSYAVNFYNGSTLLKSVTVEYGSDATYTGSTPVKDGYTAEEFEFIGWKPEPTNIQGQTDCYAQYFDLRQIDDDWATIAQACLDGTAVDKYAIGSFKPVEITYEDGTTETIDMEVIAHNHDELADGTLKWESVSARSMSVGNSYVPVVVYNNEIHVLGFYTANVATKNYLKWNGTEWVEVCLLPHVTAHSEAVVYNNEIHLLGGSGDYGTSHYKYNGTEWTEVGTLPFGCYDSAVVVYNNEIHVLGGTGTTSKHWKWDGTTWTQLDKLPYNSSTAIAAVYNNEIYLLTKQSSTDLSCYKYNGTEWVQTIDLPFNFSGKAVVYNNEIHVLGGTGNYTTSHWMFNGIEWLEVDTLPYGFHMSGEAVVYNNEIHILGSNGNSSATKHYKWSTAGWVEFIRFQDIHIGKQHNAAIIYKNEWHQIGSPWNDKHIKWDGTQWVDVGTRPCPTNWANAIIYNNEIHLIGGGNGTTNHYKYDGTEWTQVSILPISLNRGRAVVFDNEIHIVQRNNHYKYNGVEWVQVTTFPHNDFAASYTGCLVVYENEIHALGYRVDNSVGFKGHCIFNGAEWRDAENLPVQCLNGEAIVYNNELNLFEDARYVYNGSEWRKIIEYNYPGCSHLGIYRGKLVMKTQGKVMSHVLENPKATLTFFAKNLLKDAQYMNTALTSKGGWASMSLRTWCNNNLFEALPSDLQTVVKNVNKMSDTGMSDMNYTTIIDNAWIPSLYELGIEGEQQALDGLGTPYSVFTDNSSRVRINLDGTINRYWTRSTWKQYTYSFGTITSRGKADGKEAAVSIVPLGVCIGFCI